MPKALIVVDVQNDFADPKGSLYVKGAEYIIDAIADTMLFEEWNTVVLSQDWHPEETKHWDTWPKHCIADTWGAELHPVVASTVKQMLKDKHSSDPDIILKGTNPGEDGYSAFSTIDGSGNKSSTGLSELLIDRGITDLVICGIAGDVCVDATVRDSTLLADLWTTSVILPLTVSINADNLSTCLDDWAEVGVTIIGANTA